MMDSDQRKRSIKHKAVALLALRERSRFILRKKLQEQFDEDGDEVLIDNCLEELEQRGYLSDLRFAKTETAVRGNRYGNQRLKWELQRNGVDSETVSEVMEELKETEYDRAKALWDRKFGAPPEDQKEKAKQYRFLASRGFSYKTISRILRGLEDDF